MGTISEIARRPAGKIGLSVFVAFALIFIVRSLWPVPQIGTDEEVFKTVDALFTAVTSRDKGALDDCEQRLNAFRDNGTLPRIAAKNLQSIIDQAHSGQWEPSARRLYDFMLAQQRRA